MRQIILIIISHISFSLYSQTYSDLISDSEILSFIKWESRNTPITYVDVRRPLLKMVYYKPDEWNLELVCPDSMKTKAKNFNVFLNKRRYDLDTIFSKEDIDFIQDQYYNQKVDKPWKGRFPKTIYKRCTIKETRTYYYSIPVFSRDLNYVIFKKHYYCGPLCGEYEVILYKRVTDKKWIQYLVLISGIS